MMGGFELLGYAGAAVNIVTYSMRTMIPLRVMAIASNCIFIVYGGIGGVYPILVLHTVLLPLNGYRLREMLRLVADVRNAAQDNLQMDWLKPFMTKRRYANGDVLFRQGDPAGEMFFTLSGRFLLRELSLELGIGEVVGELGLLAPENRRSQTLECIEAGEVLTIAYDQVRQLYFQNPTFGFYFLRLTTRRLFQNIARLEDELASHRGRPPAGVPTATPTMPVSGSGFRQATETDAPARKSE
jgi:CRP/FNR family transcriptional regulator, cyclic AMP receptor protein